MTSLLSPLDHITGQHRSAPLLPSARGPVTEQLLHHLARPVGALPPLPDAADDPLDGEDSALALYLCYELHYRGFEGVDDAWEWEPTLLGERRRLESALEARLVDDIGSPRRGLTAGAVADAVTELAAGDTGPSLSRHMEHDGTIDELREFAVHRSLYQLKEADPHTWGIPRVTGRAKAALVEIQYGEYGEGVAERMHAVLFAETLRSLGLDDGYGRYLDAVPGVTIATCNLVSMFGLHRRWRAALLGHLALFEMCSVVPMARYRNAVLRLGGGWGGARFYDEHVLADERHQVVAIDELVAGLAEAEPGQRGNIVFGAAALAKVEGAFARHLLTRWEAGQSSLLHPVGSPA